MLGWFVMRGHDGHRRGANVALAILLLVAFVAVAWVASPLWVGLVLGTVMAFTAQPFHLFLVGRTHGHERTSAAITTVTGAITVTSVGVAAGYVVVNEVTSSIALVQQTLASKGLVERLGPRSLRLVQAVAGDPSSALQRLQSEVGRAAGYVAQAAGVVVQTTLAAVLMLVIATWTMYYVLLEWARLASKLERLLPLDPQDTRALVLEFRNVGRNAFVVTLATAVVQGLLAWLGFALAGVPRAATWGALLAIVSLLPIVGTMLIWVPVGIYQMATQHVASGAFVLAWGALVVVSTTDYVIRPRLLGSRGHTHPLLALISLLGGISVFGLTGLIVGPVVMSLFVAVLRIYERALPGTRRAVSSARRVDLRPSRQHPTSAEERFHARKEDPR